MADWRITFIFVFVLKINFSFQFSLGNLRQSRCVVSQDQSLLTVDHILNPALQIHLLLVYFAAVSCFEINNPAGCRALKTDSCRGIQVPKAPSFILYFTLFSSDLNNETMKLCSIWPCDHIWPYMTNSGSVARSGHSGSGRSGQVQRSLSLHIQGELSNNQSFKQQQLFSVWSRLCEWSENIAGRDGRQPLAASVFTGIWYLVFSIWYFAAVLFSIGISPLEPMIPKNSILFWTPPPPPSNS